MVLVSVSLWQIDLIGRLLTRRAISGSLQTARCDCPGQVFHHLLMGTKQLCSGADRVSYASQKTYLPPLSAGALSSAFLAVASSASARSSKTTSSTSSPRAFAKPRS